MGKDLEGAREVNLVPAETPQDVYSSVAERFSF
jgi:DNA-directed RNA polymerase